MRLTGLLEKHQEILPPAMFIPLLPVCGDHLIEIGEYALATQVCYSYCLRCCASAREEPEMDPPVTTAILVEAEARSQIGSFYAKARLLEQSDPEGHNRETVDQVRALMLAMIEQAKKLSEGEQYAWIGLNCSVLSYQMAMVLFEWRFHEQAAEVLQGTLSMMEACRPLTLAKFLSWRFQVYSALAFCHEEARDPEKLSELANHCLSLWDAEDPAQRPTPSQQRKQANYLGDQLEPLVNRAKGFRMIRFKCEAFPLEPAPEEADPDAAPAEEAPPKTYFAEPEGLEDDVKEVKRLLYTNFTTSHDRLVAIDEALARPWRRTLCSVEAPQEEQQCRLEVRTDDAPHAPEIPCTVRPADFGCGLPRAGVAHRGSQRGRGRGPRGVLHGHVCAAPACAQL